MLQIMFTYTVHGAEVSLRGVNELKRGILSNYSVTLVETFDTYRPKVIRMEVWINLIHQFLGEASAKC